MVNCVAGDTSLKSQTPKMVSLLIQRMIFGGFFLNSPVVFFFSSSNYLQYLYNNNLKFF